MSMGIKSRVIGSFIFLVLVAVLFFESVLIWGIHEFFYTSVENALTTRLDYSVDYFDKYYSQLSLSDVILEDIDIFWNHTACQVQIFSPEGELLMDSIGVWNIEKTPEDVKEAIKNGKGVLVESPSYTDAKTMAVSKPIVSNGKNIAVLRFITNLDSTNKTISSVNNLLIGIGIATLIITFIVGYFLSLSIVKPIQKLTNSAERMAKGEKPDFDIAKTDEIGKLAGTLKFLDEELEKKDAVKNDFISSVSHELRTPLTAIKGWAATLRDDVSDEKILMEGLGIIESESDRLTRMVEELLDFSHYASGRITLKLQETDLNKLILKTVREITPRANKFGISMETEIFDSPIILNLDPERIRQVLINVLDNAVKFSFEDGVIEISTFANDDYAEVSIRDYGQGIDEEEISRVKEKFFKGETQYSHTGLGLSIADEIMKLHNGDLEVFSELKKGTKVVLRFPLRGEK